MSVLKYLPSGDDLDIVIDDNGNMLIICQAANKAWFGGKLKSQTLKSAPGALHEAVPDLTTMIRTNRTMLEKIGVGKSTLDSLLGE